MHAPIAQNKFSIVVLASGEGTNFQAILDRAAGGDLPISIQAVISDRPKARVLDRARSAGIDAETCLPAQRQDRDHYDAALSWQIDKYQPALVVLAGFMRILGGQFVDHYRGRLLNIHPSLLPNYRGLRTHRRVLQAGEQEHGCSVHFDTRTLDGGPVIAQIKLQVTPDDSEDTLRARVLRQEHRLYPEVIGRFAHGRLRLDDSHVVMDGKRLQAPVMLPAQEQNQ